MPWPDMIGIARKSQEGDATNCTNSDRSLPWIQHEDMKTVFALNKNRKKVKNKIWKPSGNLSVCY